MIRTANNRISQLICSLLLLPLFSSCSIYKSTMSNAFDDLVNETKHTSTQLAEYRSFMSVSGLVPQSAPGSVFHNPKTLSPTHGIGISPETSYVVESTYSMDAGPQFEKILDIREKYIRANEAIVQLTALKTKYFLAAKAIQNISSSESFCVAALRILGLAKDSDCSTQEVIGNLNSQLLELSNRIQTAELVASQEKSSLIQSARVKNIIVTQWSSELTLTGLGKFASFLNFDIKRENQLSGVLIAGGIRLKTLYVGKDYACMASKLASTEQDLLETSGIDLFQIQAKHIAYINENSVSDAVASTLNVSLAQLSELKDLVDADDSFELETYSSQMATISNIGNFSEPTHKIRPRRFISPTSNQIDTAAEIDTNDSYQTIYTVRGQIKNLSEIGTLSQSNKIWESIDTNDNQGRIERFMGCPP